MTCNILIVDDSHVTRAVLEKTIRMADLPVDSIFQAADGCEALDIIAAKPVQLVMTDLNMPSLNGAQLTDQLHNDPATAHIPVVVVTAEACTRHIRQLDATGIRALIHKPFTPETVRDTLVGLLPEPTPNH
jgi:two-component system chemotaxis response regulator CheY